MSVRAYDYAAAALALEADGKSPKVIAAGVARTLRAHGHTRLSFRVQAAIASLIARRNRCTQVLLTLADKRDEKKYANAVAAAFADIGISGEYEMRIDSRLIGGFTLETAERRHDMSYRRMLRTLYQTLTGVVA